MKSLLRFLIRYHSTILFLLLEILAFIFIARFNSFHNAKIFNLKNRLVGGITDSYENLSKYLSLVEENKNLAKENVKLYNLLPSEYFNPTYDYIPEKDSYSKYEFIGARVINNSTNKQYNFITINKGRKDGIEPGMGVICYEGIVGEVKETSENFSIIISVLNRDINPLAMIKRNELRGYIEWPGRHYKKVILKHIPIQDKVIIGDTITTSGFSGIFPEGIMVGVVENFEPDQGIFYNVEVELSTNFKSLSNVLVVKNNMKKEQKHLEDSVEHD